MLLLLTFLFFLNAATMMADVVLLAPQNGATLQNPREVVLQWARVEGAIGYCVYTGSAPDALSLSGITTTNYYLVGGFQAGETIYWQIAACDINTNLFDYSEIRIFTTGSGSLKTYKYIHSYETENEGWRAENVREVDFAKSALLIIDFWEGEPSLPSVESNLLYAVQVARRHNIPIIHLPYDGIMNHQLAVMPWEPIWDSFSYLDDYLRALGIETLFYTGFITCECVLLSRPNSILHIAERGFKDIILIKDCSGAASWMWEWAVNGVETLFASTTLSNFSAMLGEEDASLPVEEEIWNSSPLLPDSYDYYFGTSFTNADFSKIALVLVNALKTDSTNQFPVRIKSNTQNNIAPLLRLCRKLGFKVIHINNGYEEDESCKPVAGEFVITTNYYDFLGCVVSNSLSGLIFVGNFLSETPVFPEISPWSLGMWPFWFYGVVYNMRLIEDAIVVKETPESYADKQFKKVFLERATCYNKDLYKISSMDILRNNYLKPLNIMASKGDYDDRVLLSWNAFLGAESYSIYRAETNDVSKATLIGGTASTYFYDETIFPSKEYFYWISANTPIGSTPCGISDSGWSALAAFEDISLPCGDFDGDGKADPAVFLSKQGWWFFLLSSLNYEFYPVLANVKNGVAVCRDYDGDRLMDRAIYNPQTGYWNIIASGWQKTFNFRFGGEGWSAAPADYDGDGKPEPAIYSAAVGIWVGMMSSQNYNYMLALLPLSGERVISADYDGDGKADPATYCEADGLWEAVLSAYNYQRVTLYLGGEGYEPVPADYDGDGKVDPAVAYNGMFNICFSSGGYVETVLYCDEAGLAVPADYDGSGKTAPAVYSPSTGVWKTLLPSAAYQSKTIGYMPLKFR